MARSHTGAGTKNPRSNQALAVPLVGGLVGHRFGTHRYQTGDRLAAVQHLDFTALPHFAQVSG